MTTTPAGIFKGLDIRTNVLGRDPSRSMDMNNVYLDNSDTLRNRPFFSNYTFDSLPGKIRGAQTASFKSYKGAPVLDSYRHVGPYVRYMLLFCSGSYTAINDPANVRGSVYRVNSLPAAGSVLQETTRHEEDSTDDNYHQMKAQYDVRAQRRGAPFVPGNPVKGEMLEDVLYFLGIFGLWKSDGLITMRAGCPHGNAVLSGSGTGTKYYRSFLAHIDFSGAWVFGDYTQYTSTIAGSFKASADQNDSNEGQQGFIEGLFDTTHVVSSSAVLQNSNTEIRVTVYSQSIDFGAGPVTVYQKSINVGDYLTIYQAARFSRSSEKIWKIRCKSVSTTEVVLDREDCFLLDLNVGGGFKKVGKDLAPGTGEFNPSISAAHPEDYVVNANYIRAIYKSTAASSGYRFVGIGAVNPFYSGVNATPTKFSTTRVDAGSTSTQDYDFGVIPTFYPFTDQFENCYDEAKVKGLLPITVQPNSINTGDPEEESTTATGTNFKYLAIFNNVILAADDQKIYYSDPNTVGSTCENFDPRDFFIVGSSEDGPIIGIFANTEYVVVHREKETYYVSGTITAGGFRSDAMNTDRLGTVSHWAQTKLFGQNYFISRKGVHAVSRGGDITELGTMVSPIMKNEPRASSLFGEFPTDLAEVPSVVNADDDFKSHVYTFYRTSGSLSDVLVFNYRVKEWYKWTLPKTFSTNSDGQIVGAAAVKEGVLWTSDGDSLNVETSRTDTPDAAYSEGFWQSVFRSDGEESLEKLYKFLKLFSFLHDSVPSDVNVKVGFDMETPLEDQGDMSLPNRDLSPVQGFNLMDLKDRRAYFFSFRVSSDAYLELQGYQLDAELVQGEVNQ